MFYPKGLRSQYERAFTTPQPSPILGRALCLTAKDSPVPGRVSHLNDRFNDSLTLNSDTDIMVAKIGSMFPTVSDTHIRILLKKYHNREAVVISALQVEKHPLVTPGPLTMSPSAARLTKGAASVYSAVVMAKGLASTSSQEYYLPFTTTPNSSPSLFRPPSGASSYYGTTLKTSDGQITRQHSPKMKLKYLKSIFPKADEMMILEILSNNDNNVQKVSEELLKRGFVKKDTNAAKKESQPPPPVQSVKKDPAVKTASEKLLLTKKYQKQYPLIAERIITIALESVDYKEELTEQILNSVVLEQDQPRPKVYDTQEVKRATVVEPKEPTPRSNTDGEPKHRSNYTTPRHGPNQHLRQGPRDALLLADYMPWTGPDPELRGSTSLRATAGPSIRTRPSSLARGPASLAQGPQGSAKGSTYHKNNKKSTKM